MSTRIAQEYQLMFDAFEWIVVDTLQRARFVLCHLHIVSSQVHISCTRWGSNSKCSGVRIHRVLRVELLLLKWAA